MTFLKRLGEALSLSKLKSSVFFLVLIHSKKSHNGIKGNKTPPKTFQDGFSCIDSKRLLVLAYAIAKKTISENNTKVKKNSSLKTLTNTYF